MDFELQPTLEGRLIALRPLAREDFDSLHTAAADAAIWEQHPEPDRWRREVFQRYFDSGIESGGALAVIDIETGRIIGSSRYCNLKPDEREVEIGWTFLERAYWGGEYNRELKSLMLGHAFRFVERVVFVVGKDNLRSRKALEKIGARLLREFSRSLPDGSQSRHVIYAIERSASHEGRGDL